MAARQRAGTFIVGATLAATVALTSVSFWHCVSRYGLKGILRYVWEGDAYTPEARASIDKLDAVESSIQKHEELILEFEVSLARARLDSLDEAVVTPEWITSYAPRNLQKDLAMLSYDLDAAAATVDSVPSSVDVEIKKRKKLCSQHLVFMMKRVDVLLECYSKTDDVRQ